MAAAYSEPVYERLRLPETTGVRHLLAFTRPVPHQITTILTALGASPCPDHVAECYATLWELPTSWAGRPSADFLALDATIAAELAQVNGKENLVTGYWTLGSPSAESRNQTRSNLLSNVDDKSRGR